MTPAEQRLWNVLRANQLRDTHFRRQHPAGGFVLDFYCPRHKLAIELDGSAHDGREGRDDDRTAGLSKLRIRVIRFRNGEVFDDLPGVLARIEAALEPV